MGYFDDLEIVQATHKIFGYHVSKPIDPPYLSLCLLRKGELIVMKDGAKRHLKAPFIFWALPGHVYQFVSGEARSRRETIWLDLGGLRARRIRLGLEELASAGGLGLPLSNCMGMALLMLRIINLNRHGENLIRHRLIVYVEELIGLIHDEAVCGKEMNHDCALILEAAEQFKRNPAIKYDLQEVARTHAMSYDTFRKKFKFYIGQAPHEFLLNCKIELAVELMRKHEISIKEIADSCGFADISSFSRMFRKRSGLYPREFRKNMSESSL